MFYFGSLITGLYSAFFLGLNGRVLFMAGQDFNSGFLFVRS